MRTLFILSSIFGIVTVFPIPSTNMTSFINERGPWTYKFEGENIIGDNDPKDCYDDYFDCAKIITVPQVVCGKAWYYRGVAGYYESMNYSTTCLIEYINCKNRITDKWNYFDTPKLISDGICQPNSIWQALYNSFSWFFG